jgi:HAD superfamily hydrolase (TIGR01549 family)
MRDKGRTMIKAIAFDFGGTIFSTERMGKFTQDMENVFIDQIEKNLKCDKERAQLVFVKYIEEWTKRRNRGGSLPEIETSSSDLLGTALNLLAEHLEKNQIVEILNQFHAKESEQFTPLAGVVESIPCLASKGCQLYIVSNNPWPESIWSSLRRYNLESYFKDVIVSSDVGYRKPHQQIFDVFLSKVKIPSSEILFVGDSYTHDIETP